MHQNAFGGRAPPGPAGGAKALPRPPSPNKGGLLLRGGEGRKGEEGRGKGEGKGGSGRGKGEGRRDLARPEKNFWRRHWYACYFVQLSESKTVTKNSVIWHFC